MGDIKPVDIDDYIAQFPEETAKILESIKSLIKSLVPNAQEVISYGMPSFKQNGKPLVYFAAFKNHIGFYALPSGNSAFKKELLNYKTGKGSIQFPLNKPIPYDLITKIVKYRIAEVLEKEK